MEISPLADAGTWVKNGNAELSSHFDMGELYRAGLVFYSVI